jgi:Chlorophyllase enzyme
MFIHLLSAFTILPISHLTTSTPHPPPTGQYPVSFTQHVFNHTTTNDPLAPNGTTPDFIVTFYYPSSRPNNGSTIFYLDPPSPDPPAQPILATTLSDYYGYDAGALANLTAELTFQGLTLTGQSPRTWHYPTLIFLPEFGLPSVAYTSLLIDLASHGYIVAALDHPYESPVLLYPYGGPLIQGLPLNSSQTYASSGPTIERALAIRLSDTKVFLDFYPAVVESFSAPFNFSAYAVLGHGLGGTAAVNILCDPAITSNSSFRMLAAVDLDGAAMDASETIPVLFLHSDEEGGPTVAWGNGKGRDVVIEGARHNDFSDVAVWKRYSERWRTQGSDEVEKVGSVWGDEMVELTRSKVVAFLGQVVDGNFGS